MVACLHDGVTPQLQIVRDTLTNGRKQRRNKDYSDSESEPRSIVGMGSSALSLSSSWTIGAGAWVTGGIEAVVGFGPRVALLDGNGSGGGGGSDCARCPVSAG